MDGEKKHISSSSRRGQVGGRGFPPRGSGFSPAKCLQSGGHLHQGVLSPSPRSPQYPKTRTSNEQPQFSVLIPTPDSVSRLMKLFRGSGTERQNSNQVRIKSIYRRWRSLGRGDHFLSYEFIERTTERWTNTTKPLLIASSGHQAPRKGAIVFEGTWDKI